jgi:DNA-binding NarL/FixJ family response regulator
VRVIVAEDSVLLREGLCRLLEEAGMHVVAAVGDGDAALAAAESQEADLAILDVRMPPTFTDEGVRAALELRLRRPALPILILSQYVEERYAVELLSSGDGGLGYLLKERVADVSDFVEAARRVAAGGSAIDPEVVAQLLGRRGDSPLAELTPREREVLELMAQGRSNGAIAEELFLSEGAIEKHVRSIFQKLGLAPAASDHRRVLAVLAFLGQR